MFDNSQKAQNGILILESAKEILTRKNFVNRMPRPREEEHCVLSACCLARTKLNIHPRDYYGPTAILPHILKTRYGSSSVVLWNDHIHRTVEDVHKLLSDAITFLSDKLEKTD